MGPASPASQTKCPAHDRVTHDTKSQESHGVSDRRQPTNAELNQVLESGDKDFKAGVVKTLQRSITDALETHERIQSFNNEIGARTKGRRGNPGANTDPGWTSSVAGERRREASQ